MKMEITPDGQVILSSDGDAGVAILQLADGQSVRLVDDGEKLLAYPTPKAIQR